MEPTVLRRWSALAGAIALTAFSSRIATAQTSAPAVPVAPTPSGADSDPWQNTNRKLYHLDRSIDRTVLRPGVVFYHHATPKTVRRGIGNALSNMTNPVIFLNDVAQLRLANAGRTLARLAINSTIGIAGLFDVAADAGIAHHDADFGQTLGRYGVGTGPYIYLPVLGPTTVRDLFGRGVDTVADPLNTVRYDGREELSAVRVVFGALQARDEVDPLLKTIDATATDSYVTIRSLYLQNRASLVAGAPTSARSVQALPDFGPEPGGGVPTSSPGAQPPPTSDAPPSGGAPR